MRRKGSTDADALYIEGMREPRRARYAIAKFLAYIRDVRKRVRKEGRTEGRKAGGKEARQEAREGGGLDVLGKANK